MNYRELQKTRFLFTFFLNEKRISFSENQILNPLPSDREKLGLLHNFFPDISRASEDSRESEVLILHQKVTNDYIFRKDGQIPEFYHFRDGEILEFYDLYATSKNIAFSMMVTDLKKIQIDQKKFILSPNRIYRIGRNKSNDIVYDLNQRVSRDSHILLKTDANLKVTVIDKQKSIPLYVNNKRINEKALSVNDEIQFLDLKIRIFSGWISIQAPYSQCSLSPQTVLPIMPLIEKAPTNLYKPKPRITQLSEFSPIIIDSPPSLPQKDDSPLWLVFGPTLTMAMGMIASSGFSLFNALSSNNTAAAISSGIMAGSMLTGSLIWPFIIRRYQEKQIQNRQKLYSNQYQKYINEIESTLLQPAVKSLYQNAIYNSPDINDMMNPQVFSVFRYWERSKKDSDFLKIRIGEGKAPSRLDIQIPKNGFSLESQELRLLPINLLKRYQEIEKMPIEIDLLNYHLIGISGNFIETDELIYRLIIGLSLLHSPNDVRIAFISDEFTHYRFNQFVHLPHVWNSNRDFHYDAISDNEIHELLTTLEEEYGLETNSESNRLPHTVIFISKKDRIKIDQRLEKLLEKSPHISVVTLSEEENLSEKTELLISCHDFHGIIYSRQETSQKKIQFEFKKIDYKALKNCLQSLKRLRLSTHQDSISNPPKTLTFLQLYECGNVKDLNIEKRWTLNQSENSLAAPIGLNGNHEPFFLDIHENYHGCHGLIAGTTGSGKSEFLESFVASLAINYSPDRISFLLIDFKGGDMARPFIKKQDKDGLPHLAATISNLSENTLYRAAVSLDAEIKRRQKIFNQAALDLGLDKLDINSYQKYFGAGMLLEELPHLVIVVDEFAQLKIQYPEFLEKLINVAQVGRSLGIHLILATQKPSGIVDPQIWSNSRFKICLKVSDKQDSIEMIRRPDSAFIKNPGRLNIQIGYDEIYDTLQSGYSGAPYLPRSEYVSEDELTVSLVKHTAQPIWTMRIKEAVEKTNTSQLEAIVGEIAQIGRKQGKEVRPLWKDPLPTNLNYRTLENSDFLIPFPKTGSYVGFLGGIDRISDQEQQVYGIDFLKSGNIGVYGAPGTGKTNLIHTLIYSLVKDLRNTPEELKFFALDFGKYNLNYLLELPHTQMVISGKTEDELSDFILELQEIIESRKKLFQEERVQTFNGYKEVSSNSLPLVLVFLENYSQLRESYPFITDKLNTLISIGKAYGVKFIITGTIKNSIHYSIQEYFTDSISFIQNDSSQYFDIFNIRPEIKLEEISGRGFVCWNGQLVEFQCAQVFSALNEVELREKLIQDYKKLNRLWNSAIKAKNMSSNQNINPEEKFQDNDIFSSPKTDFLILGRGQNRKELIGIDFTQNQLTTILTNKNTFIDFTQIFDFLNQNPQYTIYDFRFKPSIKPKGSDHLKFVDTEEELEEILEDWKKDFNERLDYPEKDHKPIIIIIEDFNEFFEAITDSQAEFFRKIPGLFKNPSYKVFFITQFNPYKKRLPEILFESLIVKADLRIVLGELYNLAETKIEKLPIIKKPVPQMWYWIKDLKQIGFTLWKKS